MTLKKLLVVPLIISLAIFIYFSAAVTDSFAQLLAAVKVTPALITTLVAAVGLQLIGHWIRARKTALLFGRIKEVSTRFQFRALSIGYLFNTILPLRLGELIRARIIAGAMTISFSYAFILIVFERLVDAMFLGAVGLVVILLFAGGGHMMLIVYAVALLAVGALLLTAILLLMHQNRRVLRLWHRATALLNENLMNSYRFKGWSVIYGLQRTLRPGVLRRYLSLTALSWLFYGSSLLLIVEYFLHRAPAGSKAALTAAPYYGVAIPSGPANLGVFSSVIDQFARFLHLGFADFNQNLLPFNLTVWAVLVLPIAVIGIVLLFGKTRETLWQSRPRQASRQSLEHKLYRQEDISDEMKHFLDNYFSGNSLSKIVHQLELSEGFRLIKYFKGGSDAITILALQNGREIVKKIIPLEFEDRLKAQYDWLAQRNGSNGIVRALKEERAGDYYAIDLAYDPDDEMLYEYLHRNPIAKSRRVMDEVWANLYETVYDGEPAALKSHPKDRQAYIDKHIFGCFDKAAAVEPELIKAAAAPTLIVNGREYDNFHQVMRKIKKHPQAWKDIATYRRTGTVHGDVIVDNLLVSRRSGRVLIIDPAPDGNIIDGPVFDFGKNLQSLHCGYETLLRDEEPVLLTSGNHIDYRDLSSDKYHRLADYVRGELAPRYLSDSEQRAMLFHAGSLFIRRLKHQIYYTPVNVLKFYAVGVKTLNEFLGQYEPAVPAVPAAKKPLKTRKKTAKKQLQTA